MPQKYILSNETSQPGDLSAVLFPEVTDVLYTFLYSQLSKAIKFHRLATKTFLHLTRIYKGRWLHKKLTDILS